MKKIICTILTIILGCSFLTACGNSETDTESGQKTKETKSSIFSKEPSKDAFFNVNFNDEIVDEEYLSDLEDAQSERKEYEEYWADQGGIGPIAEALYEKYSFIPGLPCPSVVLADVKLQPLNTSSQTYDEEDQITVRSGEYLITEVSWGTPTYCFYNNKMYRVIDDSDSTSKTTDKISNIKINSIYCCDTDIERMSFDQKTTDVVPAYTVFASLNGIYINGEGWTLCSDLNDELFFIKWPADYYSSNSAEPDEGDDAARLYVLWYSGGDVRDITLAPNYFKTTNEFIDQFVTSQADIDGHSITYYTAKTYYNYTQATYYEKIHW